jgi:hypothetical protein
VSGHLLMFWACFRSAHCLVSCDPEVASCFFFVMILLSSKSNLHCW